MSKQIVNYQRIERAIGFLAANFRSQPDLDAIARQVHLSPFHFQRIFMDWVGISPKRFLQYLTLDYLREKIQETTNIMEAADIAGLSSQSRVYDLFVNIEGVTPDQFKRAGLGLKIFYGYHPSPFGMCFIAVAEKGICGFRFIDEERKRNEYELFSQKWHFASLVHKPDFTQGYIQKIFKGHQDRSDRLNLLVRGTNFQLKVWEALVKIPFGSVATFRQIARSIEHPNSARAVGLAVAANPILYLIPCHRIIRKSGSVGDYHWGKVRKQTMIGWEMAKNDEAHESGC